MPTIRLIIPKPFLWQERVISEAKRFNVVCIGRRAGKSELGKNRCADPVVMSSPVGWFSPTYKDMLEVWRDIANTFTPIASKVNASERRIELITGGVLEFWSLDNPNAGRGRKYKRVIIDEAAFVPHLLDSWNHAIRPTLADLMGDAWVFSTPKGRNDFHTMWSWGQDPLNTEWQSWLMPSHVNPTLPLSELEDMKRAMPERVYLQEIEAQFVEDAGGVFRRVMDAATAKAQDKGIQGHGYIFGVDWGKHQDFTVISVLDTTTRELVAVDRFNQIDYQVQLGRLSGLFSRFNPDGVIVERNSIGDPLIEQLQRQGLPVIPFNTNNASKAGIIDALALAFERAQIKIIPDQELINELQAYEMERLPSGTFRYNAPSGLHDDMVISLALAWHGLSTVPQPLPKHQPTAPSRWATGRANWRKY